MGLMHKLGETWRFLRYGPTEARKLELSVRGLEQQLQSVEAALTQLIREDRAQMALMQGELQREAAWMRNRVGGMAAALDRLQAAAPAGAVPAVSASAAAAEEGFYPTLERSFRGSPEHVRQRQEVYRPWIDSLPEGPVADIGCGRGEWLDLVRSWGRAPRGVDLNAVNVAHCRESGLDVSEGDAVAWLQAQPEGSLAAVTAFHVVEHLPFGVLLRLVQEAARALCPGGRLILETPNPENLSVATQTFWLDPTHQRPLPPPLLELVARNEGLALESTLRLNPPAAQEGPQTEDPLLKSLWLQGRDYAVVARKPEGAA